MSLVDVTVMAAQMLAPLRVAGQDKAGLWRLLYELSAATEVDDALWQRFGELVRLSDLGEIAELVAALGDPDDPRQPGDIVGALVPLVERVLAAVRDLAALNSSDVDDLVEPMDDPRTWRDLALLLPGYLLGRFLDDYHPVAAAVLGLLGSTLNIELPDGDGYPQADLAEIGSLLSDPSGHLRESYGWGGDFDYPALLDRVAGLARATGCQARVSVGDDGWQRLDIEVVEGGTGGGYQRLVVRLGPALNGGGIPDGVAFGFATFGSLSAVPLGEAWLLAAEAGLDEVAVELRPGGVTLAGPSPRLILSGNPETPWALLGSPTGTRLELTSATVEASTSDGDAQVLARLGNPDAGTGLRLLIGAAGTDSFLATLLGGDVTVDTALAVQASMREGILIAGSAGFTTTIVIERGIGPIVVHRAILAVRAADSTIELLLTVSLSAAIGPIEAAVDGLGLRAALVPAAVGRPGMLGSYDLLVAFQPPAGVGLGLDLGPVSGGGYLFLDPAAGSYAGVLDLQVLAVGINAIGIIDTAVTEKATEGDGWSLFFALYLSIPSLQLGFGFTLTGLGGLAGINRGIDTEALGAAVRSGAIDAILFPEDPVADAPFIIDSLKAMFPPSPGRYVFGPVVRLGWGTPSLIEAEVGLVISLPDPIVMALLGSMSSILPTEDLDLVALRVDVVGVIDFGAGTLAIDASLHDSHVAQYALSGDLSLRADFLGAPDFLMALGGAHPGFDKPAGFPAMRRLSLAISAAPVIAVHFDCYFALATNSVQFGASFGISAEIAGFGIEGGSHFDALVYFSPFEFQTSIGCYVCITAAGIDLAGVWLDASLSGPNPWLVVGTATFKLLGFKEKIRVDERIGSRTPEAAPQSEDLFDDILIALSTSDAWTAVPSSSAGGVLVAQSEPADDLVVMPDGRIRVSQKVVPLNIDIDKVGDAPSEPYQRFELEVADAAQDAGPVQDWFAPGYYFTLGAAEQLSAPSFELMDSGIEVGGGEPVAGKARTGTLAFEQILRDPQLGSEQRPAAQPSGAAAWSLASGDYSVPSAPLKLLDRSYAVTDPATGAVLHRADSWSKARQSRAAGLVVPSWEASG